MALSEPAAVVIGSIVTAISTGTVAWYGAKRTRPVRRSRRDTDEWRKFAEKMSEALASSSTSEIEFLRKQLDERGKPHDQ